MSRPLEKITINIYKGDMDRLKAIKSRVGASVIIRNLIASFLERVDGELPPLSDVAKQVLEEIKNG